MGPLAAPLIVIVIGGLGFIAHVGPDHPISVLVMYFVIGSTIFYGLAFIYFAVRDPRLLQSESFRLREKTIAMIRAKGSDVPIDPASLEMLSNPDPPPPALLSGDDES